MWSGRYTKCLLVGCDDEMTPTTLIKRVFDKTIYCLLVQKDVTYEKIVYQWFATTISCFYTNPLFNLYCCGTVDRLISSFVKHPVNSQRLLVALEEYILQSWENYNFLFFFVQTTVPPTSCGEIINKHVRTIIFYCVYLCRKM